MHTERGRGDTRARGSGRGLGRRSLRPRARTRAPGGDRTRGGESRLLEDTAIYGWTQGVCRSTLHLPAMTGPSGRRCVAAIAVVVLSAAITGAAAAPLPPTLQGIAQELVQAGSPGAIAIVRTPTSITRAVAGLARVEPPSPMRATHRYRVASVTKTFVATLVLQLVSEHKVRLSDSVERWLPGLVPNGRSITLQELLNDTSGLFDYTADRGYTSAEPRSPAASGCRAGWSRSPSRTSRSSVPAPTGRTRTKLRPPGWSSRRRPTRRWRPSSAPGSCGRSASARRPIRRGRRFPAGSPTATSATSRACRCRRKRRSTSRRGSPPTPGLRARSSRMRTISPGSTPPFSAAGCSRPLSWRR